MRLFRRRPRTDLERENAALKQQLAAAGLLIWYYSQTRRPCGGRCTVQPKHQPRHRWKTNLHAPTEVFTRR